MQPERLTGQTPFDRYHPAVGLAYCTALLLLCMCAMQPVYVLLTFAGLSIWRASMLGARQALRGLLWQAPLVLVLAVANPVFVGQGSTEIFRIGAHPVYLEALIYGACQGFLLVNTLLAFSGAAKVVSADKFMALAGNVAPVVTLMVSMVMRLVPQFARRGADSLASIRACTAANGLGEASGAQGRQTAEAPNGLVRRRRRKTQSVGEYLRLSTVLVGWGLEDSLEAADAMRARGWGSTAKRTSYVRYRFRAADGVALAFIAVLAVSAGVCAWAACAAFSFYPVAEGWVPWAAYLPYACLLALPVVAQAVFDAKERNLDD